jgi:membrane complex biogenesis BtpA family protein
MADVEKYKKVGVDSIIFENDHDVPYAKPPLDPKAIELMLKLTQLARKEFDKPIGIQMLEAANEDSLRIAGKSDLDFIRVEAYVFAHVGNNGIIEGCSAQLQRKKTQWGYKDIKIFTDVKKKHCAHALTADLDITDEVKQAEFSMVDGFIVTSKFTGIEPSTEDLEKVKGVTKLPVFIGSGMTKDNMKTFFPLADGFIVGSTFRKDGNFFEEIDQERLKQFMDNFNSLKE